MRKKADIRNQVLRYPKHKNFLDDDKKMKVQSY